MTRTVDLPFSRSNRDGRHEIENTFIPHRGHSVSPRSQAPDFVACATDRSLMQPVGSTQRLQERRQHRRDHYSPAHCQ